MDYTVSSSRSGYTLPVFACAAAIAAFRKLQGLASESSVTFDLIHPAQTVTIPIEQVAMISPDAAIAICRSDPGDNLDITKNTPVWAKVTWADDSQTERVHLEGGDGIGRYGQSQDQPQGQAAIYGYAQTLIQHTLVQELNRNAVSQKIQISIILPEGEVLALRTSNSAFGVVQGLSLLGTSGIAQALSAPAQLEQFQVELTQKAQVGQPLVFCLGENGLDLARKLAIPESLLIKTANWLGPMLTLAGQQSIPALLLLGYHGKLIKLAGGIFHTHHHLADGRQEILAAIAAQQGLTNPHIQNLLSLETLEACLQYLSALDEEQQSSWTPRIYAQVTQRIEQRAQKYILTHAEERLTVGCLLFNRSRKIFAKGTQGIKILDQILASLG